MPPWNPPVCSCLHFMKSPPVRFQRRLLPKPDSAGTNSLLAWQKKKIPRSSWTLRGRNRRTRSLRHEYPGFCGSISPDICHRLRLCPLQSLTVLSMMTGGFVHVIESRLSASAPFDWRLTLSSGTYSFWSGNETAEGMEEKGRMRSDSVVRKFYALTGPFCYSVCIFLTRADRFSV